MMGCFAMAVAGVAQTESEWVRIVPSTTVELRDARSISVSAEGLLYVADTGHHRVLAVDTSGTLVAETGGFGNAHGQFQWPRIVVASRGNAVWVMDYGNRRIEKFTRSLEYLGTLEIRDPKDNSLHQPEAMALAPPGDLYVYDRDGGRIVRYDPLFRAQAEIGGGSGGRFISDVSRITFVPALGLLWSERGNPDISRTDAMLNPAPPLRLNLSADGISLADADSCLIMAGESFLLSLCSPMAPPDTIGRAGSWQSAGVRAVTALAVARGTCYLLDGAAGAVYRATLTRE